MRFCRSVVDALTRRGAIGIMPRSYAPVAQLDRVPGYEPGGRAFESLQARHTNKNTSLAEVFLFVRSSFLLSLE